ncbi:MAG: HTH-type transcriptional regulator HdfR [Oceanospirillaceae bacterium]|uniref:HTH-type transcriptional regulator HdfR n=1 Tax=unclassified Thalassolituus TaxID=2624967 RepID=UPI000C6AE243|nr:MULTISPECIES: HTH-type transcriptional regulator HdfR [unclassified Thalassolituus]MAS24126.1 HTH-type transcriptional regulator HdfR [Oceanospirillaceae bacterium]MBL33747.1 HTH-type transcriptional regulator HdfR [Oceanospirillaceae bacterium]MBS51746.1 HTH-type transcriptional regulator HdfR [Oceanospirillaceae bacterium]|tara:strand:- start:374 stop:1243 length:870 start_codon:yes stop_codon:yes gene_type:complete
MDTELLKTFMEVSRTRHFGRAAENLYLTQSAVSFRVRQLEGLLGVELFSRQRNNIRLTPAGEKLLPLAESSVMLEQRIRQEVATAEGMSEQISLGATPNLWDAFLQDQLTVMMNTLNGVALNALAHSSGNLVRQIAERTLDLAFVFDAPKAEELTTVAVLDIPLYLVSSQPQEDWQSALESNYVLVDWGTSFRIQHAQEFKGANPPMLQTNTGRIALDCLLSVSGGGAAYLPVSLIRQYVDEKRLFIVPDAPVVNRTVYASFQADSSRKELISDIIGLIRDQLSQTELL